MSDTDTFRSTRIPLTHGSGAIPALGFGTLIRDLLATQAGHQDGVGSRISAS